MTNRSKFYLPKGVKVEWLFQLDYKGEDGEDLFTTWGKSEAGYEEGSFIYPVFERGMLNISTSDGNHFKVMLKDGRVKGDDGKTSTTSPSIMRVQ